MVYVIKYTKHCDHCGQTVAVNLIEVLSIKLDGTTEHRGNAYKCPECYKWSTEHIYSKSKGPKNSWYKE
jgi:hypothetical protein